MSQFKILLPQRKWQYAIILTLLLVGLLTASQLQDKYFKLSKNIEIFASILRELDTYYIDEIDPDTVVKTGIDAMLQSLDPYTNFIPEEDLESFKSFVVGDYCGIGALIGPREGKTIVVMLYQDCPAHKGGLRVGDIITHVNGQNVIQQSTTQVINLLRGAPSTQVQVTIERPGLQAPLALTLTREKVTLKNVPYFGKVTEDIGYICLANFTAHAADEVKDALENLKTNGVQKVILDLRGNPGGLWEEAIKVVNLFIDQGLMVVETRTRIDSLAETRTTQQPAYDAALPIIVLIDEQSASASEIVAGVLQDYDRGILIGKNTYGKGLVQLTRPLSYNTQLKLTISKYYIPSGRSIQKIDYHRQRHASTPAQAEDVPSETFTTRAGRKVHDGSGIAPDIEEEKMHLAPITTSLRVHGLIFDYATQFQNQHEQIAAPKAFSLSEAQYSKFITWLKGKEYPYTIEHSIDRLQQKAEQEAYTNHIKEQIEDLKKQVQHCKAQDLQQFKQEIKLILQEAIISRYYFQAGAIQAMLAHDQNIQRACALFQNMEQYRQLLQANNE